MRSTFSTTPSAAIAPSTWADPSWARQQIPSRSMNCCLTLFRSLQAAASAVSLLSSSNIRSGTRGQSYGSTKACGSVTLGASTASCWCNSGRPNSVPKSSAVASSHAGAAWPQSLSLHSSSRVALSIQAACIALARHPKTGRPIFMPAVSRSSSVTSNPVGRGDTQRTLAPHGAVNQGVDLATSHEALEGSTVRIGLRV